MNLTLSGVVRRVRSCDHLILLFGRAVYVVEIDRGCLAGIQREIARSNLHVQVEGMGQTVLG